MVAAHVISLIYKRHDFDVCEGLCALRARSTTDTYIVQRLAYYHVNISPHLLRVCVWLGALRGVVMPRYYKCIGIRTFILLIVDRHTVIPMQSF